MRDIIFRGYAHGYNKYVYGFLSYDKEREMYIIYPRNKETEAGNEIILYYIEDESSIGQYTGLKDKNGVDIYEGDIVIVPEGYGGDFFYKVWTGIVNIDFPESYLVPINKESNKCCQDINYSDLEIIGNIHKNQELLK